MKSTTVEVTKQARKIAGKAIRAMNPKPKMKDFATDALIEKAQRVGKVK